MQKSNFSFYQSRCQKYLEEHAGFQDEHVNLAGRETYRRKYFERNFKDPTEEVTEGISYPERYDNLSIENANLALRETCRQRYFGRDHEYPTEEVVDGRVNRILNNSDSAWVRYSWDSSSLFKIFPRELCIRGTCLAAHVYPRMEMLTQRLMTGIW